MFRWGILYWQCHDISLCLKEAQGRASIRQGYESSFQLLAIRKFYFQSGGKKAQEEQKGG